MISPHSTWCATQRGGTTCNCDWFEKEGRNRGSGPKADPASLLVFSDIQLLGWKCRRRNPLCGVFTGEEKEIHMFCRACGFPRPTTPT